MGCVPTRALAAYLGQRPGAGITTVRCATMTARYQLPRDVAKYESEVPPLCLTEGCVRQDGRPKHFETYFLCRACAAQAPCAFSAGLARRPLNFYKLKPPAQRDWTRKTNATVLATLHRFITE